jgi:hypothetical protein
MTKEKKEVEVSPKTATEVGIPVEKSSLELLVEKMQEEMKEVREQNKMLIEIANESRKDKWNEKNLKNKIVSIVKVSTLDGKIITSWRNVIDEVFKESNGNWTEKQINEYVTEDGEKILLPLLEAVRKIVKVEAEVLSIAEDKEIEGNDDTLETTYLYKVKTGEGKEVIISNKFIN